MLSSQLPRRVASSLPSQARTISSSSTLFSKNPVRPTRADGTPTPRQLTFIKKSGTSIFKTFLPVTPSLRQLRQPVAEHLHPGGPLRALTVAKRSSGGRNHHGRITVRARGGGHKRRIRNVDFTRLETGEQDVVRIEYDPGRSAHIALIRHRETKGMSYILAPKGLRAGDVVQSFRGGIPETFLAKRDDDVLLDSVTEPAAPQTVLEPLLPGQTLPTTSATPVPTPASTASKPAPPTTASIDLGVLRSIAIRPGNVLPLRLIPLGTVIHGISLTPTGPAVLARSAGASARLMSLSSATGKNAQIKLSSGEVRFVGLECVAAIGEVSNEDHQHENLGKAGRMRWLGFRPQARGVAMNSRDHPHGGGRGKSKGNRDPVDPWGNSAKGGRTRAPVSKNGNKMVVKERPRGTEKNARGR